MRPKTAYVYYGSGNLTAPQVAALAAYDIVILGVSGYNGGPTGNIARLHAANPNCKVVVYIQWVNCGAAMSGALTLAFRQKASDEKLYMRRNPASGGASALTTQYNPNRPGNSAALGFDLNLTKVGSPGGMDSTRIGVWYVRNVMPTLVPAEADGVFVDVASPFQVLTYESTVEAAKSGTLEAGTTATVLACSTVTWAAADVSRFIRITSGAAAGLVGEISAYDNVAHTATLNFPLATAPAAGDTFECYTLTLIDKPNSKPDIDYLENGTSHNNDSLQFATDWANALDEALQEIMVVRPATTTIIYNSAADCKQFRALDRNIYVSNAEGAIGTGYEIGWTAAMSLGRNRARGGRGAITAAQTSSATDWAGARYALAASMMAGTYLLLSSGGYSSLTPIRLDEHEIDYGTPGTSPAHPDADGLYRQQWSAGYVVANPTDGSVVVNVPAGYRRIRASDYGNQDATLNDGSTDPVTLASKRAVMFVPV